MQYPEHAFPSTDVERAPVAPMLSVPGAEDEVLIPDIVSAEPMVDAEQQPENESTRLERAKNWARRHKMALLLGAAGASAAISFSQHPGETVHEIETKVPWAVGGMIAADGVNLVGIGMMATSAGSKVDWKHFWRVRSQMGAIADHASDSKLFNAGFWTSTTGGVGAFGVAAAAVLPNFPVESWGILTPLVADLGHTVMTRVVIKQAVSTHAAQRSATSTELVE